VATEAELRLVVEDVFRIAGRGTVLAGPIESGILVVGASILIRSGDRRFKSIVSSLEVTGGGQAVAGATVGFRTEPPPPRWVSRGATVTSARVDAPWQSLDTEIPTVLLPVRLETRFQLDASQPELLIRIYPDACHVHTHEPELTAIELEWGRRYWTEVSANGTIERAEQVRLWSVVAERFGPGRAAWIRDATRPERDASGTLVFPDPALRESAWTRAPVALGLPDFWVAVGYQDGRRVFVERGADIPRPLTAGPDPDRVDSLFDASTPGSGDTMNWMVDFEEAVRVGMGMQVALTGFEPREGLDLLMVFGLSASRTSQESSEEIEELFDGHRFTDRLAFLPQGTPTNNTPGSSAGFQARADIEGSFEGQIETPAAAVGTNAERVATALGLPSDSWVGLRHGAKAEQSDARAMNTVLWRGGWGYFLDQLLADRFLDHDDATREAKRELLVDLRRYFIDLVRGRGPLPSLRIGRQPYGLLPVVRVEEVERGSGDLVAGVAAVASSLLPFWEGSVADLPRARRGRTGGGEDPYRDLLEVLAKQPGPAQFMARPLFLRNYLVNALNFGQQGSEAQGPLGDLDSRAEGPREFSRNLLSSFVERFAGSDLRDFRRRWGLDELEPRIARGLYADHAHAVCTPIVETTPLSEARTLEPDYLRQILDAEHSSLLDETAIDAVVRDNPPLLYLLARHAALLEYANLAFFLLVERGELSLSDRLEPEIFEIESGGFPSTRMAAWPARLEASAGVRLTASFAAQPTTPEGREAVAEFAEFWQAFKRITELATAELERLTTETLDLSACRLDAWFTSVATKRLGHLRSARPSGVHVGGYGWVEDLRPKTGPDDPDRFIHAPSLTHAATGVVLRSGYLTHGGASNPANPLAVDLSSSRVREARWLLEGVRGGRSPGELLGYRFERALYDHELPLQRLIPVFRRAVPLIAGKRREIEEARDETVGVEADTDVVDGLALLRRWSGEDNRPLPWRPAPGSGDPPFTVMVGDTELSLPPADTADPDFAAIDTELRRLSALVDATGDLLTAESVHQLMQANPVRSGASVDALSRGETPPQDYYAVETPRSGAGVTHRVLLLANASTTAGGGSRTPRAAAAPDVAAWAARLLPDPGRVGFVARYLDRDSGTESGEKRFLLSDLPLTAIDLAYVFRAGGDAGSWEIENRFRFEALRARPAGVNLQAVVEFVTDAPPDVDLGLADFYVGMRALTKMLHASRAARASDLEPEGQARDEGETPGLLRVANGASTAFEAAINDLRSSLAFEAQTGIGDETLSTLMGIVSGDPVPRQGSYLDLGPVADLPALVEELGSPDFSDLETLLGRLARLADFGVPGALPPVGLAGEDGLPQDPAELRTLLVGHAMGLTAELRRRSDAGSASIADRGSRERLLGIFGRDFLVLDSLPTTVAGALSDALAAVTVERRQEDFDPVATWMQQAGQVRPAVDRLAELLLSREILSAGAGEADELEVRVGHWPAASPAPWVGLAAPRDERSDAHLSFVVVAPENLDLMAPLAGIFVDEWTEIVPESREVTGVAFRHDAPLSRPPQSILLAVPGGPERWSLDGFDALIQGTLRLAKIRLVDRDVLRGVGHFLPALHFPDLDTDLQRTACPPEPERFPAVEGDPPA